jgi:hypothetical protein
MDLVHPTGELGGQVVSAEMDIDHRGLGAAMSSKGRDLVEIPASASQIGQAEMA